MSEATAYRRLEQQFLRAHRISHASTFLGWDQMVMMPAGGSESRAEAMAELASIHHQLLSTPEMAEWFDAATLELEAAREDTAWQQASLLEMRHSWHQATAVPADLLKAQVIAGARCEHGWRGQRARNDWPGFLRNFETVVELSRQEARCRQDASDGKFDTPYDALLDLHCRGDNQALVTRVFARLKSRLPQILEAVMEVQAEGHTTMPSGTYSVESQKGLCESLMRTLGFDFSQGRLDVSAHPFSTGVLGDQRITTRFREDDFLDALQATAHETGHASYESGLPQRWSGLPVGCARNMCIHESQSLLFEKQIFGSRAFTRFFIGEIHKAFASTRVLDADALWSSLTKVAPSYIRVEADEVTYPLHIMLRYDIESALINGQIEAGDIPDMWDESLRQYLGLSSADDHARGCLQDIHWTDGSFGYFPSYTLGAVNAAQMFATVKADYDDWDTRLARGDVGFIRDWLSSNVWQRASVLDSQSLMQQVTGEGSNPEHLLTHLEARYVRGSY